VEYIHICIHTQLYILCIYIPSLNPYDTAIIASLGGGPVEQGRIGNALSKEERVRTYIKDKHGSLINFLLSEFAKKWFDVSAGING